MITLSLEAGLTREASDPAHGVRLSLDVGQERSITIPLEALFDQGPEHDLDAHG